MPSERAPGHRAKRKLGLTDDPDESWREYGRTNPYFGVLSADRFRAENLNETTLAEFFTSGEQHVARVLDIIGLYLNAKLPSRDALDFGCGVGRLVLPLAVRFRNVVGVDISDAYIAEAKRNCDREGLTNVAFAENIETLISQHRQFDLVHSYIVFNHIPWKRGKDLIAALFGLLRENGVLALHVLHRRHAGPLRRAISALRRNFLPVHWLINLGQGRPALEPLMQGNEYPLDELLPYLSSLGAGNFHVRIEPVESGHSFAFIFCTKAEPPPAAPI